MEIFSQALLQIYRCLSIKIYLKGVMMPIVLQIIAHLSKQKAIIFISKYQGLFFNVFLIQIIVATKRRCGKQNKE